MFALVLMLILVMLLVVLIINRLILVVLMLMLILLILMLTLLVIFESYSDLAVHNDSDIASPLSLVPRLNLNECLLSS